MLLWIKSFHVIFVVAWYAGLLYLPRLFVYHAQTSDEPGQGRFVVMERRLFGIMTVGAAGAIAFGLWTLALLPGYLSAGWMHAKLLLVALLLGFHAYCLRWMRGLRAEPGRYSPRFFRVVNELPALVLVAAVILVVVKPF